MTYEELLMESDEIGLITKEKPLQANKGRIKGNRIAIKADLNTQDKACVLAEELGHHYTTVGNILELNDTNNAKQELKARIWAYNKMIGLTGLIRGYNSRCHNRYELAEYLGVTEEFLQEAINYYSSKYGCYTILDNYLIGFTPSIYVMELF